MAKPFQAFARDEKGVLKKRSFNTLAEAERWKDEMQARRDAFRSGRRLPLLKNMKVGEYVHYWLQQLSKKRPISTVDSYARALRLHVLRYLNDKPLAELDQADFETLLDHIQAHHGLDNATRNRVRSILHRLYEDARVDKLVTVNPISLIERKKENPGKVHSIWTEEQCRTYLAGAKAWRWDFYVFTQLELNGGFRKSEALALPWGDILWDRRVIRVQQLFEQATGQIVRRTKSDGLKDEVKTKYVGMTPVLEAVLREHFERSGRPGPTDLVLKLDSGKAFKPRLTLTMHHRLCEKLGLPKCRIHDLRHTMATLMLRQLKDIHAVQKTLGHTDLKTTQRYVHTDLDDAAERMGRFDMFSRVSDTFSDTLFKNDTRPEKPGASQ
jgi:site-specific recombinase XerD